MARHKTNIITIILLAIFGAALFFGCQDSQKICPAPAIPEYSRSFNRNLADQIRAVCSDPGMGETCQALKDAYKTRQQIKACQE